MKQLIKELAIKKLDEYSVKDVVITGSECGANTGYIELLNGFKVGFVFFTPDHLSFTMSKDDIKNRYERF
jgi:hypothetical protein